MEKIILSPMEKNGLNGMMLNLEIDVKEDKELLDYLELSEGCALISDDRGNWAVSCSGMQNIEEGNHPIDIETIFFIEKSDWKPSIREAIKYFMDENEA